ncbi:hypothetical protein GCM10011367_11780 [Marinicauda pacifica]|jgi:hypothetical protein|uniref:Uncharacterized protein n=1 Tax=Marinicauda pacifica TaxID=1133559 RepID=A0A4S2HFC5_9PROT|nr:MULTISPECIES: hypothetical protein [Marinicauda]TGY94804.1 hypothetical protein E5162_05955 [Marinicauda pacifica]GGE39008.1 hypothetical protein GCM10011367_11780 [Marinicauda pacifica]
MNIESFILPDRAELAAYLPRLLGAKVSFSNVPHWRTGEERSIKLPMPSVLRTSFGFHVELLQLDLNSDMGGGEVSPVRPIGANYALLPVAGIKGSYSGYLTPKGTVKAVPQQSLILLGGTYSLQPGGSHKADRFQPILTRVGEDFSKLSGREPYVVPEGLAVPWLNTTQTPYPLLVGAPGGTYSLLFGS